MISIDHPSVSRFGRGAAVVMLVAFALINTPSAGAAEPIEYNRDVRPILAKHCFACHGHDGKNRKAKLRLDQRKAAVAAEAVKPGEPDGSELVSRIESDDPDQRMPPAETGRTLTKLEKRTLRLWIAQGAKYQRHWSFAPPKRVPPPKPTRDDWARAPLDLFVLKKLEENGLAPSPPSDRAHWLRRVSLDLTGLPPTLKEADAFLADKSDKAFEKVVDRLLKSDAYGEHWARLWLDLARYADTKGYEKDRHRDIWRYRDWVIDALNRDMPYDRFTIEQLAGDLLPERTSDQILATAFHRNTMTNEEGGTDNEEFRVAAVKDRVDTTIQVWMGLTMGCAKCHSHKYDPISVHDYYSLYAYFNQTQDADRELPLWPTPTASQAKELARLKKLVPTLRTKSEQRPEAFAAALKEWRRQFEERPLWRTMKLLEFTSENEVRLAQNAQGNLIASGERPEKDVWTLTFDLPKSTDGEKYTALRIDHFPSAIGGGDWPDANVAIRELTVELIAADGKSRKLKLTNPRATHSQSGWQVARAIDGNPKVGWALSPKFAERQAAIFDLKEPISGGKLKITLEQQHGQSLLLARSRFSISRQPTSWLRAELEPDFGDIFAHSVFPATVKGYQDLKSTRAALAKLEAGVPKTPVMLELGEKKRRKTTLHIRGNFLDPGDEVSPAVMSVFGEMPRDAPANRLGVARWLMQAENPLTARVMVNRVWARLFGVGLVETEEDFGGQGLAPSHPRMLDWLAVDFRERGWSIKQLIRGIVLSSTYRQSARATEKLIALDPRNRLLGRGPRFRLTAETVRDQALAVSGLLTRRIGGPSVMPPQPGGVWKSTYNGQDWINAKGPDRFRRGIYTYKKRTSPYPAMITFDAGSGEVCQIRRVRTNTPLQALVTLNDTVYLEAAGALATRMEKAGESLEQRLARGFRLVLIRAAEPKELELLVSLYRSLEADLENAAELLKSAGLKSGDARLVVVANVLLNLDETLMKP